MKEYENYQKMIQKEHWSNEYQTKILPYMIADCEYFCNHAYEQPNCLFAGSIESHIGCMRTIVQNIGEDIITDAELLEYEKRMKDVTNRMRFMQLYEVEALMQQMNIDPYPRLPEWSSDHKEIPTDYAILIPYIEKDSNKIQLLSMEQIYAKLEVKNAVKKNTKIFDQTYLNSLSSRIKYAIENNEVFIDLDNENSWYVKLDGNPDDPVSPFMRSDGCYTHMFGQFRYYPKNHVKLNRKEQFQAIQTEFLDKLLDKICEYLDRFDLKDANQEYFALESQILHWPLFEQYRQKLSCFLPTPAQCDLSKIINGKSVSKKVFLWGTPGTMNFTVKDLDSLQIVGAFTYEGIQNDMDVIKTHPFEIQNIGDKDFPSLLFYAESTTTRYVMKHPDKYRRKLIDFLSQQEWIINDEVVQIIVPKNEVPIWFMQAARMVFNYPGSITCRHVPAETGPIEYLYLVSRKYDLDELFKTGVQNI